MSELLNLGGPRIGAAEAEAVQRVLASGQLAQGPEVLAFEQELASELSGTRFAVAVSSGSAALELAMAALGVGPGDEVVTTPFTFPATVNAVLRSGATVRFADIGPDHLLDPSAVASTVSGRTALIVAVHLYGLPCDVDALAGFGVPVLEDAAQAHLATVGARRAGSLGSAGSFSFYASKNMTTGEGGAVTTDSAELAERIRVLRNQGMRDQYDVAAVGWNLRMTDLAAAIGRAQLRKLPAWTAARRRVAEQLLVALEGIGGVELPSAPPGRGHAWHRFTIILDPAIDREVVVDKLAADGIQTRVHYPWIVPDLAPYAGHPLVDTSLPLDRARAAAARVLSLPAHPELGEDDVDRIASALRAAVASARSGRP